MKEENLILEIDGEKFEVIPLPFRYEKGLSQWIIFDNRLIHCLTQLGDKITSVALNSYDRTNCLKVISSTKYLPGVKTMTRY